MISPPVRKTPCTRGAPAWMVTFADMMTLLLCLFALLLSFAVIDAEKYRIIAQSMKVALGGDGVLMQHRSIVPPAQEQPAPPEAKKSDNPDKERTVVPNPAERRAAAHAERLRALLKTEIEEQKLHIEQRATKIIIRLEEKASFPSGSADLEVDFSPVLAKLADAAHEVPGNIIITGHTDDRPISGARFRSNWELSAARAATVVEAMIRLGQVEPSRLEARGMAEHAPLAPNDSDQNRAQNRRVEIMFEIPETDLSSDE